MAYEYDEETPFLRRPRNLIAAVVAVVIVAAALWMVLGRSDGTSNASPPTTPALTGATSAPAPASTSPPTPTETAARPVGSNYDSACGLTGGTTIVPTETPSDVRWQNVSGWYFPISNSAGPSSRTNNGPWSCFGRTPTGAALAASTIPWRLLVAGDFTQVVRNQTVPGVAQEALLALGRPKWTADDLTVPKGFLVDSYSQDAATVTLHTFTASKGDTVCSVHVQWFGGAEGDWLLRLEPDGSTLGGCIAGASSREIAWGPR